MSSTEKEETEYELAKPIAGQENGAGVKQGHKCCGGCCDMRRAVIIVDLVNMCLVGFQLMAVLAMTTASANVDNVDDDKMKEALANYPSEMNGVIFALLGLNVRCQGPEFAWKKILAGHLVSSQSILTLLCFSLLYTAFVFWPWNCGLHEVHCLDGWRCCRVVLCRQCVGSYFSQYWRIAL